MLRWAVAGLLVLHGLALIGGVVEPWPLGGPDPATGPSLITAEATGVVRLFDLLWIASAVAFVGSGSALVLSRRWWRPAAVIGLATSVVPITVWWEAILAAFGLCFVATVLIAAAALSARRLPTAPG